MADGFAVEFQSPAGELLRFEWDANRLAELRTAPATEPVWRLAGELDWDEIERVRVLSIRLADDRLLAIVALRPAGAEGHGDELVTGLLGKPGELQSLNEALVSTEYARDGVPRRVGLELYPAEGALATRLAADVDAAERTSSAGIERVSAALTLRGSGGAGVLDQLQRA